MVFDFFDSLTRIFAQFTDILSYFDTVSENLEEILVDIESFDFVSVISPYLGTIRYVAGDYVYLTLAKVLQIGLFILLIKVLYQLVTIVVNSFAVQKPLSIIKTFMGF
jgi:hypothetical protein